MLAFTTALAHDLTPVDLGSAGDFIILSKTGISTVAESKITGDIGVSPAAATYMTGFSLVEDASHPQFSSSAQVVGRVYAADYGVPTPAKMTTAISDMETAYTDAASRHLSRKSNLNRHQGLLTGKVFKQGVYAWDRDISFTSDIYLDGDDSDIFIFQTTGNVIASSGAKVMLKGGVKPCNVVWQVGGFLEVDTGAHLEGIFLVKTKAVFKTGSSINGRVLVQTAVTLDQVTATEPACQ